MDEDPLLSALVVLRPEAGPLTGYETITAETASAWQADPGHAQRATTWFAAAGFRVDPVVGLSFSIVAPRSQFEQMFRVRFDAPADAALPPGAAFPSQGVELPLVALPPDVAAVVQAVTFPPPPDFGPTGSGP